MARHIGALLRGVRHAAGFGAVRDAAAADGCPAAPQTIYAYERGGLVPSLKQFLELVEFYATTDGVSDGARYQAIAAINGALSSPAFHVPDAFDLIRRLQPPPPAGRHRRKE